MCEIGPESHERNRARPKQQGMLDRFKRAARENFKRPLLWRCLATFSLATIQTDVV